MTRTRNMLLAAALLLGSPGMASESATILDEGGLAGLVNSRHNPIQRATVYAYKLADLSLREVITDAQGRFAFSHLPAGLYKLITFKPGFLPAVTMLSRAAKSTEQFVEVQLSPEADERGEQSASFWQLRSQIPTDVLHRIQFAEGRRFGRTPGTELVADAVQAQVRAETGVDSSRGPASNVSTAAVDVAAKLGSVEFGVGGEISQFSPSETEQTYGLDGQFTNLELSMRRDDTASLSFASTRNRLARRSEFDSPVDLERYQISWSQAHGDKSASEVVARYESQNNFYRTGWLDPTSVPLQSQSWTLQGSYQRAFSSRSGLETGLKYREHESLIGIGESENLHRSLELFGSADYQAAQKVLVEYGLVTHLTDGSMALSPRGSLFVKLGSDWTAKATAAGRFDEGEDTLLPIFRPQAFAAEGDCSGLDEYCYRVLVTHEISDRETLEIGAIDREIGETLQLYFNSDLIDQMESLYLVEGDRLPELRLAVSRQLTPRILARLQSNIASGGGGVLYATDDMPYENRVRYLVTSLDTRFQASSTGVFVAFHQLEQSLRNTSSKSESGGDRELERLQLLLTQDLNVLLNLASEWAVQLNMELSRGGLPIDPALEDDAEVRRRITGGVSVRF